MKTQNNEELDAEILQELRDIKKRLKQLSKNELIAAVLSQMKMAMDQQNLNRILAEKLELKEGKKDETVS